MGRLLQSFIYIFGGGSNLVGGLRCKCGHVAALVSHLTCCSFGVRALAVYCPGSSSFVPVA